MSLPNPLSSIKEILEISERFKQSKLFLIIIAAILFSFLLQGLSKPVLEYYKDQPEAKLKVQIALITVVLLLIFTSLFAVFRLTKPTPLNVSKQIAALCYKKEAGATKFLLQKTKEGDAWNFPKGNLEDGKDDPKKPYTAAKRWAKTESGVIGNISADHIDKPHTIWHVKIDQKTQGDHAVPNVYIINLVIYLLSASEEKKDSAQNYRNPQWFTKNECCELLRQGRSKKQAVQFISAIEYFDNII